MNPDSQTPSHTNKRLKGLVDAPSLSIVQYKSAAQTALMIPEIVALIGSFLPLFKQRVEEGGYYFVDTWLPQSLLRAGAVCKLWYSVLTPLLWQTYDLAIMAKKVPYSVLASNIGYVRNISLMDKKHKKHTALWDALANHKHIDRLEVHEAVFPAKKLIGPKINTLTHLKLSGNCERMHPFLIIFLERQVHLKSLELTRFKFTASDWKRIITNKPKLCKLTIGKQCDFKNFDDEEVIAEEVLAAIEVVNDRWIQVSVVTDVNRALPRGSSVGSKRKSDDDSCDTGIVMKKRRKNRTILVSTPLPDAKNFGVLPITHLVIEDNRLMLPFQRAILEASPNLEQLEMCYTQKSSGREIAAVMRDNCRNIKRLTLTSTRQPWTLAMLENMPQSVEELILQTGQLDAEMTTAIIERAAVLKRLDLDFGQGTKGRRRLACILSTLQECKELREFSYHNHAEDNIFKVAMFKRLWNLPKLHKLTLHGVSPRAAYRGIPQVPVIEGWKQGYGGRIDNCCSARSRESVHRIGRAVMSPLFDVALLNHISNLPQISEVRVTEAVYRRVIN